MVKTIVINGAGTSGKDTFIDQFIKVVQEESVDSPIPVYRFSSVDQVKEYATLMGWDGKKDNKGRRFLSDIKDALTRYNNAPFIYMMNKIIEVSESNPNAFIFFHVREPEEIDKMVKAFGATTILLERSSVVPTSYTNHADNGVYDYQYTYYVQNNGTILELRESARSVFHDLMHSEEVTQCQP